MIDVDPAIPERAQIFLYYYLDEATQIGLSTAAGEAVRVTDRLREPTSVTAAGGDQRGDGSGGEADGGHE